MIEMLFSLFIFSLGMSLMILSLPLIIRIEQIDISIEDENAMHQLRQLLLLSSEIRLVNDDELNFYYLEKEAQLILENDRLVRKDGYVIYMEGIKDGFFTQKKACFYINYEKNDTRKERFLGCN